MAPSLYLTVLPPGVRYVHLLEEAIIEVCARLGVTAGTSPHTGVWVGDNKICAMGECSALEVWIYTSWGIRTPYVYVHQRDTYTIRIRTPAGYVHQREPNLTSNEEDRLRTNYSCRMFRATWNVAMF